jgi:acyl-CoA thioester hydrolase
MDAHAENVGLLEGYPIVVVLPVQWGDQDAFQHVNNTIYFRWFESARVAYTRKLGLTEMMIANKVGPILAATACNYRAPVTFPDTVRAGIRVARMGRSSLTMEHVIFSETQNAIVAEGTSTSVLYDYTTNQSCPIPDAIREAIEALEGRTI